MGREREFRSGVPVVTAQEEAIDVDALLYDVGDVSVGSACERKVYRRGDRARTKAGLTEEMRQELLECFRMMDVDGDGVTTNATAALAKRHMWTLFLPTEPSPATHPTAGYPR